MLEESLRRAEDLRPIREEEKHLVAFLLEDHFRRDELLDQLNCVSVADLADGGMGSIRFVLESDPNRTFGSTVSEVEWDDADRVPVSAALNLDVDGNLYELDIWKVDFAPLLKYPTPDQLRRVVST